MKFGNIEVITFIIWIVVLSIYPIKTRDTNKINKQMVLSIICISLATMISFIWIAFNFFEVNEL
jgi:hypothetical protein